MKVLLTKDRDGELRLELDGNFLRLNEFERVVAEAKRRGSPTIEMNGVPHCVSLNRIEEADELRDFLKEEFLANQRQCRRQATWWCKAWSWLKYRVGKLAPPVETLD